MKRNLLSIFFLLIVTLAAVAQPRISSNKETHNFGQIELKRPVTVEYTITNTGNQPLVLTNFTTSCALSLIHILRVGTAQLFAVATHGGSGVPFLPG